MIPLPINFSELVNDKTKQKEFDKLFELIKERNDPDLFIQALKAKYGSNPPMFPKELASYLVDVRPIDRSK
jgi:hypothetical protein